MSAVQILFNNEENQIECLFSGSMTEIPRIGETIQVGKFIYKVISVNYYIPNPQISKYDIDITVEYDTNIISKLFS